MEQATRVGIGRDWIERAWCVARLEREERMRRKEERGRKNRRGEGERESERGGKRVLVALTVATSSGPASEERSLTL